MKKIQTKQFYEITARVKETVLQFDPNAEVILFGSRARGDYKKDSDWDFLILTDKEASISNKELVRNLLFDDELEVEQCFSSIIKNKLEWQNYQVTDLFQNIKAEGYKL